MLPVAVETLELYYKHRLVYFVDNLYYRKSYNPLPSSLLSCCAKILENDKEITNAIKVYCL